LTEEVIGTVPKYHSTKIKYISHLNPLWQVDLQELRGGMGQFGLDPDDPLFAHVMGEADEDGDGQVGARGRRHPGAPRPTMGKNHTLPRAGR
jgi:hypothetical protein